VRDEGVISLFEDASVLEVLIKGGHVDHDEFLISVRDNYPQVPVLSTEPERVTDLRHVALCAEQFVHLLEFA
jgi:hypothetical protein